MGEALKVLGYKVFAGMRHNYFHDNCWPLWDEAIKARYYGDGKTFTRADFEKFLGQYEAVGGWFAALLAEDLLAAYPDAKVILTTRDPDEWVDSWNGTIVQTQRWWRPWRWILPIVGGKIRDLRRNADLSFNAFSYGAPFDRVEQRKVYVNHNERIRQLVSQDRLLDVGAQTDWKPLCAFLGKSVPEDKPYPHSADRRTYHKTMHMIWWIALMKSFVRVTGGLGLVSMIMVLVVRYWRRRGKAQLPQFLQAMLQSRR